MLSTLRNAWKVPELRKRLIFTFFMIVFFRMGNHIPVPGIDTTQLMNSTKSGGLFQFYDMISGGAFSRFSIFAMSVGPYITASIVIQLLTVAVPRLESLSKEGQEGRKKIQKYTRYAALVFCVLQAYGTIAIISNMGAIVDLSKLNIFLIIVTLTTSSMFVVWLGEQITAKGIGNGISLMIFVNIISQIPTMILTVSEHQRNKTVNMIEIIIFAAVTLALLVAVVIVSLSERRIPVQYAGKGAKGGKTFRGQSTHIPINVNSSGVIAIIFSMSIMRFPATIATLWPDSVFYKVINGKWSIFKANTWQYAVFYFLLIVFFTWFYTEVTFKPDQMSENMHKSSGFIPGIRPGEPTTRFIESVLTRVSILGGSFVAIVAIFPIIVEGYTAFKQISLSGTALLIIVGVSLETMKQIESQLVMRHYQGFLK